MIIKAANGYYSPSFFNITIESDENLEDIISNNEQTFVHEYIHFLQDLILPYCIRLNLTQISQLGCMSEYASSHSKIVRPFQEWNDDCHITNRQMDYTWGDNEFFDRVSSIRNIERDFFTIPSGPRVYRYFLYSDKIKKYQVGARDMLEYIAHKIESKHWEINTYDFPYRTVDKLFEFYGLFDVPVEVRLCIVEYCLYNDNPIHILIKDFFESGFINNNKSRFTSYPNCKEFLLGYGWESNGGFKETIFSKTRRRLNDFNQWLINQYQHPQYSEIRKWVNLVSEYIDEKLSKRLILSEFYTMNYEQFIEKINEIIKDIGIPLIFNNKKKCACMLPIGFEPQPFTQFYVMLHFLQFMNTSDNECPLIDFCNENFELKSQDKCHTSPLLFVKEEELCPLASFMKSYGFERVNFVKE